MKELYFHFLGIVAGLAVLLGGHKFISVVHENQARELEVVSSQTSGLEFYQVVSSTDMLKAGRVGVTKAISRNAVVKLGYQPKVACTGVGGLDKYTAIDVELAKMLPNRSGAISVGSINLDTLCKSGQINSDRLILSDSQVFRSALAESGKFAEFIALKVPLKQ